MRALRSGALLLALCQGVATACTPTIPVDAAYRAPRDPATVARGKYLVEAVAGCWACHSQRDFRYYSGPPRPGSEGMAGRRVGRIFGVAGSLPAPNLTPAHLGNWSDGEIRRALVNGLSKDGHPQMLVMPYDQYGIASKEDVGAIIAYLRTLATKPEPKPARRLEFPLNLIVRTMPIAEAEHRAAPKGGRERGGYLVDIAGCPWCHSPLDFKKEIKASKVFAGGNLFYLPGGRKVQSPNITPDPETGIGRWSREVFIAKFKAMRGEELRKSPLPRAAANSVMPWFVYAELREDDLSDIYDYLMAQRPILSRVETYPK